MKRPFSTSADGFEADLMPPDPELLAMLSAFGDEARDPLRRSAGRAAVIAAAARAREAALTGRGMRWRRRAAIAGLGFAGANLALSGVVALAAGAQPDSVLYGVKRAAEAAKLTLTVDPQEKARLELELADRRASEAETMADHGRADLALQAARDATSLVQQARATLKANPSVANEQALQHASSEARARLEAVFAALENGTDPGAAEAARGLDHAWHQRLGGQAGDQGNGEPPGTSDQGPGAGAGASGVNPGAGGTGGAGEGRAGASPQPNPQGPPAGHPGGGGGHGGGGSGH